MSKRHRTIPKINLINLHSVGFTIIPNIITIDDNIINEVNKQGIKRGKSIFGVDRKRKQCNLYYRQKFMQKFVKNLNHTVTEFINHPKYVQSKWVVLRSEANSKRQQAHHDYIPSSELNSCPDNQFPLAVLCSLMPDTKLNVWINNKEIVAKLGAGDLLIFRGDFTHAGSAYDKENVRLHCYFDNIDIPRTNNRTYLIPSKK
jgi:hypothetical protein